MTKSTRPASIGRRAVLSAALALPTLSALDATEADADRELIDLEREAERLTDNLARRLAAYNAESDALVARHGCRWDLGAVYLEGCRERACSDLSAFINCLLREIVPRGRALDEELSALERQAFPDGIAALDREIEEIERQIMDRVPLSLAGVAVKLRAYERIAAQELEDDERPGMLVAQALIALDHLTTSPGLS